MKPKKKSRKARDVAAAAQDPGLSWERDTISAALRAGWKAIYPEDDVIRVPEFLWHYTTAASIDKVLESRSMFATHFEYLNDPTEVTRFSDIAHRVAATRVDPTLTDETEITTVEQYRAALWHTVGQIRNIAAYNAPFVVSFSADGDLLGQWRAYAGNCSGYALALSPEWLHRRSLEPDPDFRLWRVVYNPAAQERLVAGVLDTAIAGMANAWGRCTDDSARDGVLHRGT